MKAKTKTFIEWMRFAGFENVNLHSRVYDSDNYLSWDGDDNPSINWREACNQFPDIEDEITMKRFLEIAVQLLPQNCEVI